MYYIGLDVHKRTISYCVKDASGRVFSGIAATTVEKSRVAAVHAFSWTEIRKLQMASSEFVCYQRTGGPKLEDDLKGKLYLSFINSRADEHARYSGIYWQGRRL